VLDFSIGEFVIIATVALVVIGPKEYPVFMKMLGRTVSRIRQLTASYRNQLEMMLYDDTSNSVVESLRSEFTEMESIIRPPEVLRSDDCDVDMQLPDKIFINTDCQEMSESLIKERGTKQEADITVEGGVQSRRKHIRQSRKPCVLERIHKRGNHE